MEYMPHYDHQYFNNPCIFSKLIQQPSLDHWHRFRPSSNFLLAVVVSLNFVLFFLFIFVLFCLI